jgi:hypothetical protein
MLSMSMASCGDLVFYQATYDYAFGEELYALYQPSVGIAEQAAPDRDRLYPNPATDQLFMTDMPNRATLRLYASNGALALETDVHNMAIGALPAGLYLARITAPDGMLLHVQPVMKEF